MTLETVGFIGGGNMAEALIAGLTSKGTYGPTAVWVSDVRQERLEYLKSRYQINISADSQILIQKVSLLVLSVKPQVLSDVLSQIAPVINPQTVVISIAAGKTTGFIRSYLTENPIVRAMPNTPALIGQGITALYARAGDQKFLPSAERIFSAVGKTVVVSDERLMDAVTAVSGSGPAYFFLWMEHLISAAWQLGLSESLAKELVLQTAVGATLLAQQEIQKGTPLAQLRQNVTSPGGTTAAALEVFSTRRVGQIIEDAVSAAYRRSIALSG